MKRVIVGLSGGVDSSVAAYLLKEQGYEVIGLFMKNWHDDSVTISNECPWLDDSNDAMLVAEKLGIPFQTVDLSKEYKERIVDYMFKEYESGRTPNPDVLCNREIKFDVFMKIALDLGADFVATGHYCRKGHLEKNEKTIYQLLAGKDQNKDQSYFLCQLSQEQLSKTLFPIGELTKPEVRAIATKLDLVTAEKKDSQGLCFIGKVKLPDFLQQQLKPKAGVIVEIPEEQEYYFEATPNFNSQKEKLDYLARKIQYSKADGKIVGEHQGAHFFTKGQRKGLAVGGTAEPLFVLDTDVDENVIYTGQGKNHPGLLKKALFVKSDDIHWIREDLALQMEESMEVMARIRYRQPLEKAKLYQFEHGLYVEFEKDQSAITEGQFVAWYLEDELVGSGVIS
ncbi:MAG: tRNA 2-thiouridine(34) synthase MnmA [Bacteroidia bacterium]|nr:tRNA 2-thiouridine(34) synthase MnmA [Bacteroidia bacterium]NND26155.1 tRNA 2-thiouridine(34) synthase MnmA [Flavobacteriaceae bacterium]MBT8278649.1 tRNA 2-thiouridine(34) synthase MnmA [Bacteroidia bacterium]NNK60468.1 tRNA 2-thiouridine(34) synthase MnmA [Flavobacteriaceae bacterium]NNL33397.1 tRNA 2-thiouridine(34) synthase MnmA [Flavobacteriaceae bacterium]